MNIFKAEASVDGLAEQVLAKQSVAYSSEIRPWTPTERETFQREQLSQAFQAAAKVHNRSIGGAFDLDLYFTKSILVSTNWNKNDDVFAPEPVWAARHTPSHKRTNIDHDESSLVGHITETWALDGDGNLIPDHTVIDDLPELFHLANGAVIYTKWEDDDLVSRTSELIGQIEAGKKFVSMEALFSNFDYAIVTPEKKYHIVARGQDTAFLTKHLKIYGGSGIYDGCSVGRLLRNITFSGKGYVDKPANPYSVIFNDAKAFDHSTASTENPFLTKSGVSILCSSSSSDNPNEDISMPDSSVDLLRSQNDDLKQSVASLNDKVEKLTKSASEAGVKALEGQVEDLGGKLEATEKERDEANATIVTLTSEKEALGTQLTEANEAKDVLEKVATEAKEAQTKADRVASLVDGGVDKEVATSKVETFASLNDDQFATISEDIIAAANFDKDAGRKDKKNDDKSGKASDDSSDDESRDSADANTKVLDDADASSDEAGMSADASDEVDETEALRADLRTTLAHRLGHDIDDEDDDSQDGK